MISALIIAFAAFVMETIDAGLGMGYGTVLTPLLIAMGYNPLLVVPSVLISQAFGGLIASVAHHKLKNVQFSIRKEISQDMKIVLIISTFGVIAAILGVLIAVNIPMVWLKMYIGILVSIIGIILISGKTFKFSWKNMFAVGLLASFNKGLSGGGFGPVTTGGQIIGGNKHKNAIGCTTLSEAPICIVGFLTFFFINGLTDWNLVGLLSLGSFFGALTGATLTQKLRTKKSVYLLGIIILCLGLWTLYKVWIT